MRGINSDFHIPISSDDIILTFPERLNYNLDVEVDGKMFATNVRAVWIDKRDDNYNVIPNGGTVLAVVRGASKRKSTPMTEAELPSRVRVRYNEKKVALMRHLYENVKVGSFVRFTTARDKSSWYRVNGLGGNHHLSVEWSKFSQPVDDPQYDLRVDGVSSFLNIKELYSD